MATDRLYDLAFQFKASKLWTFVSEGDLFAVKLSDGEMGYCVLYGMSTENTELTLYVGEEGYKGYCLFRDAGDIGEDIVKIGEIMASQNFLQCTLAYKYMLSGDEVREVQQYAKARQISLRGQKNYPRFSKYQPGRQEWPFDSALDEQRMSEALSAMIYVRELLEKGVNIFAVEPGTMLLLTRQDGQWTISNTPYPEIDFSYPEPLFGNEIIAEKIKRKRKAGIWQCGTIWLPTPYLKDGHEDEAPFLPLTFLCADQNTDEIPQVINTDVEDFIYAVNTLAKNLSEADIVPRKFRCGDDRCFALLKDFCNKTGIRLERANMLKKLDEGRISFLQYAKGLEHMDVGEIAEELLNLSDEELAELPQELVDILLKYGEKGEVPQELLDRVKKGRPE